MKVKIKYKLDSIIKWCAIIRMVIFASFFIDVLFGIWCSWIIFLKLELSSIILYSLFWVIEKGIEKAIKEIKDEM